MISTRCLFKRPFLLFTILFTVFLLESSFGIAHAQTQTPGIKTDRAVYPEPALQIVPHAGDKFRDPVFGTEIMRATDLSDCAAPGCGTFYNQWPTFNSDNTRIMIRKGESGDMIIKSFDPATFTLGSTLRSSPMFPGGASPQWQGATWSHTDPDLIFVHANYYSPGYPASGMKVYKYKPSTNVFTLLKDFAPELAPGQPDYLFEMHVDAHDEIFTFMQNRVGNQSNPIYFLIWKKSTDTVLQHLLNDSTFDANNCNVDKSGRWVYCGRNKQAPDGQTAQILDLQTNTWQKMYWNSSDDAASHGDIGTGILVGHGNFSGAAVSRKLSDVHTTTHHFDYKDANGVTDWTNDQHMSLYADDENWAMVGMYDYPGATGLAETGAFENELMQIALDGSQRFRRLFHHRSHIDNLSDTTGYWAAPKATISQDGRFIAFTSNWNNSGRYDLFIAKIDPPGSGATPTTPSPTPTPTPAPTPQPTPTASPMTVASSVLFAGVDATTQGSWKNAYGADGYNTINDQKTYPAYAQVNASSQLSYVWRASTNDLRGLQKTVTADRLAATWYSSSFFTIDVNFSDGNAHRVALYCLDWDSTSRSQTFDVVDATTNALLDTRSVSSFNGGKYLVWEITGHVKINVTRTAGESAVVSGLYFSAAILPSPGV